MVSSRSAGSGMCALLGSCGVSFRAAAAVAVWGIGLLMRGERVGCGEVPDSVYSQGSQELNASAGAC